MVTRDCGLVLGGNIHTTLDDDDVDWEFDVHPDMQILSYTELEKKQKPKRLKMDFSDRIETLRKDIIDAIRQLLYSHGLTEITFPERAVVFQKVCLDRSLQILQICKYSDSWVQNNTPRRVVLLFVL